jgi:hypothetical protein
MMRLIDADALREEWLYNGANEYIYDTNSFLDSIDEQPTVDAAPVVHGRWIQRKDHCECSVCNSTEKCPAPFCWNCGAKMDNGWRTTRCD